MFNGVLKNKIFTLTLYLITVISIFLLITYQAIYPTIIPMIKNGSLHLFADWSVILNANICSEKGYDVYLFNPCDQWERKHVYGDLLLNIPFIKDFNNFYFIYLPVIFNLLFVYVLISFFQFRRKIENLTIIPFIFSASTILAIERANIDIVIFLLMIFVSYNKKIFFNYLSIILVTLSKFYPILLLSVFLFEKNFKRIIFNCLFLSLIIFIIFYFQADEIKKIFANSKQFTATGIYNFSFKGLITYVVNLNIVINNQDFNWIKYCMLVFCLILPLVLTLIKWLKYIFTNESIKTLFLKNVYANRLYVLSSIVVLTCYFAFSNYIYREIFFLGLIPWILRGKISLNDNRFFNVYFYVLVVKFFVSTVLIYFNRNEIFTAYHAMFTLIKHCFDFYLILLVLIVLLSSIKFLVENQINLMLYKRSEL